MATDTPGRHGAAVRIRLQVLEGRVSQSAAAGLAGGRSSANRPDGSRPAAPSDAGWEPGVRLEPVPIAALLLERDRPGRSTIQEASMTTTRTRRPFLACILTVAAAHAAGALITAAELPPQRARAQDGGAEPTPRATTADEDGAGSSWCTRIPPGYRAIEFVEVVKGLWDSWPGVFIRSLSRIRALAPLAGALRRLRIVGGVGIVFGYSRGEPASGERLQVPLQRVSNLLGIDLPVVHVEHKGF